ncbi:anti-repressor Ant [Acinetobacter phage phiAC-1]|uniref:anti-repressor Ant n=1 Tax=Acinetobacter phage phiAC-1 TaxID=1229760 RepID=UPI00028AC179|nr:anti-repressor Ant [Acinetobacter phage phiAC-1]AFU62254.1 putative DNA-binding protein [Acinetobacter phage phiAC-1]
MSLIQSNVKTMTSLEIAELVQSRHDKVKQSIERLVERGVIIQPPMGNEQSNDAMGRLRSTQVYVFSGDQGKRDSIVVVAQLSPEFTARLVDRWQELENQSLKPQLPDFTNPVEAARAWANEVEAKQIAQEQLKLAAPKLAFVEKYVESTGNKTFREVAKLLGISEPSFRQFLKYHKIMYQLNGTWTAYSQHFDAKRFSIKAGVSERNGKAFTQTLFTPKGIEWIASELAKDRVKGA